MPQQSGVPREALQTLSRTKGMGPMFDLRTSSTEEWRVLEDREWMSVNETVMVGGAAGMQKCWQEAAGKNLTFWSA